MSNINEPIPYNWTLGWSSELQKEPVVNPLLKAILEKNVAEMDRLYKQGASLKECDEKTFGRVLFHVMDNYPVMEWLVQHGLSQMGEYVFKYNEINNRECTTPYDYCCGLPGRAYYLKAYDVMELLCAHGFSGFNCYDEGWEKVWHADEQIFRTGDEKGIKILLENGYCFSTDEKGRAYYEKYVLCRPQVKRKTIGLQGNKLSPPNEPYYEKVPLFFGKKDVEMRNRRRKEDYEDNLRAYQEFKASFGEEYDKLMQEKKEQDAKFFSVMQVIAKDKGMI